MLQIFFTPSAPDLTALQDDENLRPAVTFIKHWYAGADSFTFTSSGSTGIPKSIVLSKDFLIASAKRTIELFNISSSDRLLLALNTSFMGGMMMVVRALVAGCELVYLSPDQVHANNFKTLPPIKLASLVPAQVHGLLIDHSTDPFTAIDNLLLGGAPVSKSLEQRIAALNSACHFYHTYGMTETASHVAIRMLNDNSPYQALEGFEFSQNEKECLVIHHLKNPAFTLTTNDVVHLYTPYTFDWIGRADWVINSGGIKYSLEQAEECIADFMHTYHLPNLFTSYKSTDDVWGDKWILLVTGSLSQDLVDQLKTHCKNTLGKYIYPKEILFTKKIVYLSSGKVDRFNSYQQAIKPSI